MTRPGRALRRAVLLASFVGAGLVAVVWPLTHWDEVVLRYRLWRLQSGVDYAIELFREGEDGAGWHALETHTARSGRITGDVLLTTCPSEMTWRVVKTAVIPSGGTASVGAPFLTFRFAECEWSHRWRQESTESGTFDVPWPMDLRNTYHILFRVTDPARHECEILALMGSTPDDVRICSTHRERSEEP